MPVLAAAGSYNFMVGPAMAFAVVGVLALLLRWAYGGHGSSLVERLPRRGSSSEYGLLVAIASPGSFVEGELLRRRLEDAGVRATLVSTDDGPRLMVFAEAEKRARGILARTD